MIFSFLSLSLSFYFLLSLMVHGILVSRPEIKPASPALEGWSLNYWTTRKVLKVYILFEQVECYLKVSNGHYKSKATCKRIKIIGIANEPRASWWLSGKESAFNAGDTGSIPGLGISPGEENGNPFQYCCLGNPVDRGAW